MRFPSAIDKPYALLLSPPKCGSTREFLHFALPLYIFVAGNRRHFKFVFRLVIAGPSLCRSHVT